MPVLSVASQEKIVPEKKEVPKEQETEEHGSQDDAMETESEVGKSNNNRLDPSDQFLLPSALRHHRRYVQLS